MKYDLTPSEYYLCRNMKQFRGKRFSSNEEAISIEEQHFPQLLDNDYKDGIKLLQDHFGIIVSKLKKN